MNKTELIAAMAEKSGMTKTDSKKALEAFMDVVVGEMETHGKVSLVGFGNFSVAYRAPRKSINPSTKAVIDVPEKYVVKFKAGSNLKLKK